MIAEIVSAALLFAGTIPVEASSVKGKAKAAAFEEAKKQVKKKIPSRGAPAVWCTAKRCDTGVSASFLRKESLFLRDRYWTLDAFAGKDSAGIGFSIEPFKQDFPGQLRLFVGAAFVVELDAHELHTLPGRVGLVVKGTF